MLSASTIDVEDMFSTPINILDELMKVKSLEKRVELIEKELKKQKAENTGINIVDEVMKMGTLEKKMIRMESEIERLRTENKGRSKEHGSSTMKNIITAHSVDICF